MGKVNEWLTLVTNLGVIAGLVILVYEVNQTNQALLNETDVAVHSIASENRHMLLENAELRKLYQRVETERWDDFSSDQQWILRAFWSNELDRTQLQFMLYTRNGVDLDDMDIIFNDRDLAREAFKSYWEEWKDLYDPKFVAYLDELIEHAN